MDPVKQWYEVSPAIGKMGIPRLLKLGGEDALRGLPLFRASGGEKSAKYTFTGEFYEVSEIFMRPRKTTV